MKNDMQKRDFVRVYVFCFWLWTLILAWWLYNFIIHKLEASIRQCFCE